MQRQYRPPSHGGGHGGGRGGRHYREPRGGRGPRPPAGAAPGSSFTVLTNCFRTNLSISNEKGGCWYRYHAQIVPKRRIREGDRINGELPPLGNIDDAHPDAIERMQRAVDKAHQKGRTISSSREALQALKLQLLQRNPPVVLSTDGAAMCYSPEKAFEGEQETFIVGCGDRAFKVVLTEAGEVPLSAMRTPPSNPEDLRRVSEIVQAIETILKDALGSHMLNCDETPNTLYFPEYLQRMMHEQSSLAQLYQYFRRDQPFAPFVGLNNSVRFCDGGIVVAMNNRVDFLNRQSRGGTSDRPSSNIPLLDPERRCLAGIELRNFDHKVDEKLRGPIETALKNLTFTVRYEKGTRWEEKRSKDLRDQGTSDANIDGYMSRCRVFQRSELRMFQSDKEKPRIRWGCDEEKFDKDGKIYTVESYFQEIYDVRVKFPNMPIVSTKRGFFPVEFLFQELARARNANNEKFVSDILKYNDAFAGRERISHINSIKSRATSLNESRDMLRPVDVLSKFSMQLNNDPVSVKARRLAAPNLMFGNGLELGAGNGDWNLRDRKFKRCASMSTYAVVDLGRRNSKPAAQFMEDLFQTMESHGFKFENKCDRLVQDLTVRGAGTSPAEIYNALRNAIRNARRVFLQSKFGQLGSRTTVLYPDGSISETIVSSFPFNDKTPVYGIKCDKRAATHWAEHRETGDVAEARIQFKSRSKRKWLDPTEVEDTDDIQEIGYMIGGTIYPETDAKPNPTPVYVLEAQHIECPSILFIYLPDNNQEAYNFVKLCCYLEFEVPVQSQCIVQEKYVGQGGRSGQYCSNVALKVNTKLFSRTNNATAWELQHPIPWVGERPKETVVMGYSMSHGHLHGKLATVVAGSVCLAHPMQMAHDVYMHTSDQREDVVNPKTLTALVQSLARHFWFHADGTVPIRLLAFRDGGSDGSFDRIVQEELRAIRKAFSDVVGCACAGSDPNCPKCIPPQITLVVAQTDHNIRVVPENSKDAYKKNVPSGTLVDNSVTGYNATVHNFDFLLTPQCGAKGTSKPMYYRVLTNENAPGLTQEALKKLVYEMSFQYGTATKATRKIPVLLYSDRLANQVIKYGGYARNLPTTRLMVDDESGDVKRDDEFGRRANGQILRSAANLDDRVRQEQGFSTGWKTAFRPHVIG